MLDPDVYSLLDVSVANDLVDDDTNSPGGDVVDDASPPVVMRSKSRVVRGEISDKPVVVFVRHTLLLRSVCLDVDDITDPKVNEVRRELDETLLYESEVNKS